MEIPMPTRAFARCSSSTADAVVRSGPPPHDAVVSRQTILLTDGAACEDLGPASRRMLASFRT